MANRLDTIDSGSNYQFGDKLQSPRVQRSLFDLSHLNNLTINNSGALIPISLIETLPGDSIDLSVKNILRVMPQVVPMLSRQRLYVHAFYSRKSDLWKDFNTYMTKGYTGNVVLQVPTIQSKNVVTTETTVMPESLFDYMGLPIGFPIADLDKVSALPFMMYEQIYKYYYQNPNLIINNTNWLPNDNSDFRLNSQGDIMSVDYSTQPSLISRTLYDRPVFGELHYRNWADDYFTSALPFPQRGDTPVLNLNLSGQLGQSTLDFSNSFGIPENRSLRKSEIIANTFGIGVTYDGKIQTENGQYYTSAPNDTISGYHKLQDTFTIDRYYTNAFKNALEKGTVNTSLAGMNVSFTLDQFRELAINQSILERLARTDGTYSDFGFTMFGKVSKNAINFKPTFIGGTYKPIIFSEVLQTSATENNGSPLGTMGGHGILIDGNGNLGHLESDDYGYIMVIASIMPDNYYNQGLDKKFTRLLQSDEYLPDRAKMGLVPILNKEIYYSGNSTTDNDLFAYQNPFDEFRYNYNQIHGKIADNNNLSFSPYTQSRTFSQTPNFNSDFVIADNVEKDFLSAPSESGYVAQFDIQCRAVRPLPYISVPSAII